MYKFKIFSAIFFSLFSCGLLQAADIALPDGVSGALAQGWTLYINKSDTLGAQALFEKDHALNPENILAASSYSQMLMQQGKNRVAAQVLISAIEKGRWDIWAEPALADLSSLYASLDNPSLLKLRKIFLTRMQRPECSWIEHELLFCQLDEINCLLGDYSARHNLFDTKNYARDWLIAGPFANRNREGFDLSLPVEKDFAAIDTGKLYEGRGRKVNWFEFKGPYDGLIDLASILTPGDESMAYCCTYINATQQTAATLSIVQSGASELWVNGKKIYHDDKYVSGLSPLQRLVGVNLNRGVNQVVLKIAGDLEQSATLLLSVVALPAQSLAQAGSAAEAGQRAKILSVDISQKARDEYSKLAVGMVSTEVELTENSDGSLGDSGSIWGARAEYQQILKKQPGSPLALLNMSYLNGYYGLDNSDFERTLSYDEKLVELYPECALFVASLANSQHDENQKRRLYEKALALSPVEYSYEDALLGILYGSGFVEEARQKALSITAERESFEAWWTLADIYRDNEWQPEALAAYGKCLSLNPSKSNLYVLAAQMSGGDEEAVRLLTESFKTIKTNANYGAYAAYLYRQKSFKQAEKAYIDLAREFVYDCNFWLDAASCREAVSAYAAAAEILAEGLRWMPQSAELMEATGRYLLMAGQKDKGLGYLKRSLAVVGDNPDLQAYLKQLNPAEKAFYADEVVSLEQLKGQDKTSADFPDFDQIFLLDQGYVYVLPNGSTRRMYRVISKVLRDGAVKNASHHEVYYSEGSQKAEVIHARVIQPDGSVVESAKISDHAYGSSSQASSVYGSGGVVTNISLSQVKTGSIVDIAWTIEDIGEPLYGNNFYDLFFFGTPQPTLNFRYAVKYPDGMDVRYAVSPGVDYQPKQSGTEGYKTVRWSEEAIAGIRPEPAMPPYNEIKPYLALSSFKSWQSLGEWGWNLFEPQMLMTNAMKQKVQELISGKSTREEKIKAIYDFIVSEIRYVSISFGRFGYTPHKVERTFSSRYGDCKDTAALFVAFLREAGVEAYPALVRTRNLGEYALDLPSPLIYNHAIAYAPGSKEGEKSYWLDGTTDYFAFGMIPSMDRGTKALVFGAHKGEQIEIDPFKLEQNFKLYTSNIKLDKNGGGELEFSQKNTGEPAMGLMRMFERKKAFEYMLEQYSGKRFAGGKLISFERGEGKEQDVCSYSLKVKAGNIANNVFGQYKLMPLFFPMNIARMAALSKRRYDLMVGVPNREINEVTVVLPEGASLVSMPQEKDLKVEAASFRLTVNALGRIIKLRYELTFNKDRVKVADYAQFKDFCNAVTAAAADVITYKE